MNLRNPSILVQGQVVMEVRDLLWKRKDQTPSRTQTCEEFPFLLHWLLVWVLQASLRRTSALGKLLHLISWAAALPHNIEFLSNFPRISGSVHTQKTSVKTSFHRTSWSKRVLLSNNFTPTSSPVRLCPLCSEASSPPWGPCQGVSDGVIKTLLLLFFPSFVTTSANSQKENVGLCFQAQDRKLGLEVLQERRECFSMCFRRSSCFHYIFMNRYNCLSVSV